MTVLGCTGHQAIPAAALQYVQDGVTAAVEELARGGLVGVCSLASGADQLFARRVLAQGAELRVLVPCDGYESTFGKEGLAAYRELLALAVTVDQLPFPEPTEEAFLAAGYRVAEECDRLLAVWDGEAAKGLGGTADVVAHARRLGRPVAVVWPAGVTRP